MTIRLTESQRLSLIGSGLISVLCLVAGVSVNLLVGKTVRNQQELLNLVIVFFVGWLAVYIVDRINTNKKINKKR